MIEWIWSAYPVGPPPRRAADGALEQAVRGQAVRAVDEERNVVAAVAGGGEHLDREVAGANRVAVVERLVDLDAGLPRAAVAEHRHAEPGGVRGAGRRRDRGGDG